MDASQEDAMNKTSVASSSINTTVQEEIESSDIWEDTMQAKDDSQDQTQEESLVREIEQELDESDTMMKEEALLWQEEQNIELASGLYTDFNPSLIGNTDSTVIFFHASWCPSCIAADSGISTWDIPSSLTVLKADYDTSIDLRKQYEVTAQHTFVQVDADGNMIKKWVWGTSVNDIIERIQ